MAKGLEDVVGKHQRSRQMPVMGWGKIHALDLAGGPARNVDPIPADDTVICSLRIIGGDGFFKQGDADVVARDITDSIYIADEDGWIEITTTSDQYVSVVTKEGATAAQLVERT